MFEDFSEYFTKVKEDVDSIIEDARAGEVKKISTFSSPILMNSNDFMFKENESGTPFDVFSTDEEDIKNRDYLYAYYQAIEDAFAGKYIGNRSYIKYSGE